MWAKVVQYYANTIGWLAELGMFIPGHNWMPRKQIWVHKVVEICSPMWWLGIHSVLCNMNRIIMPHLVMALGRLHHPKIIK